MSTGGTWDATALGEIERLNLNIDRKRAQIVELKLEIGRLLRRLKRHKVEDSETEEDE